MIIEIILILCVFAFFAFIISKKYDVKSNEFFKSVLILLVASLVGIMIFKYTGISGLPFLILGIVMINIISK